MSVNNISQNLHCWLGLNFILYFFLGCLLSLFTKSLYQSIMLLIEWNYFYTVRYFTESALWINSWENDEHPLTVSKRLQTEIMNRSKASVNFKFCKLKCQCHLIVLFFENRCSVRALLLFYEGQYFLDFRLPVRVLYNMRAYFNNMYIFYII